MGRRILEVVAALEVGQVYLASGWLGPIVLSRVLNYANDRDPRRRLTRVVKSDALPDRIFTRPKFGGKPLVYNHDIWDFQIVNFTEVPPAQNRNVHRAKIIRQDCSIDSPLLFPVGRNGAAVNPNTLIPYVTG